MKLKTFFAVIIICILSGFVLINIIQATSAPKKSDLLKEIAIKDWSNSGNWHVRENLKQGDKLYGDRDYKFKSVPSIIDGCEWIQPANNSAKCNDPVIAILKLKYAADVYIGIDSRINPLPSWLADWNDTGETFVAKCDKADVTYRLFKGTYSARALVIFGKLATKYNMYPIFFKTNGTEGNIPGNGQQNPNQNNKIPIQPGKASGFALLNGGTSGGIKGNVVKPSNASEFEKMCNSNDHLVIRVEGSIDLSTINKQSVEVKSNKTIIGIGSNAEIINGGLNIKGATNVEIKNITVKNAQNGITIGPVSSNVWLDHCALTNIMGTAFDMVDSDFVTVSWTKFENNRANVVVNGNNPQKNKLTLEKCWFDGTNGQTSVFTSIKSGQTHILNCLYTNCAAAGTGIIDVSGNGMVLAENSSFINCKEVYLESAGGMVHETNCYYDKCTQSTEVTVSTFEPTYEYIPDDPTQILQIIQNSVGP